MLLNETKNEIINETINLTVGDNGLITRARQAGKKYNEATNNENSAFKEFESQIQEIETGIEIPKVTDTNAGVLEADETDADTYIINSIEDLVFFAYDVRNGNTYEGKTVKLGLNLDFNSSKSYVDATRTDYGEYGYSGELKTALTSGEGFIPIGTQQDLINDEGTSVTKNYSFGGVFDGNSKRIANLYMNKSNFSGKTTRVALFGFNLETIKKFGNSRYRDHYK